MNERKQLRKTMNQIGLVLCLTCVFMLGCFLLLKFISPSSLTGGLPYFLGCICILLLLLIWKNPSYFRHEVFAKKQKMTLRDFFIFYSLLILFQVLTTFLSDIMEWAVNLFGYSLQESIDAATTPNHSSSMILYAWFAGPVIEELLFRGAVLRTLLPYGEKLAIIVSAVLFGFYHANFYQGIFAVLLGFLFAYIALKFSIFWSILLHIVNNSLLTFLTSSELPPSIYAIIYAVFAIAGVYQCIEKRKTIQTYLKREKIGKQKLIGMFTAVFLLIFIVSQIAIATLGITAI